MECAEKFLDAVAVGLQGVSSLRAVWDQNAGRFWLSGGFQRRLGLQSPSLDELAAWGLIHPDDHARVLSALEALQHGEPGPVVVRAVRRLLAPGVWGEFDSAYGRLNCGGLFGKSEQCSACGLVIVSTRECVAGEWVDVSELLEGDGEAAAPSSSAVDVASSPKALPPPLEAALEARWAEFDAALERSRAKRRELRPHYPAHRSKGWKRRRASNRYDPSTEIVVIPLLFLLVALFVLFLLF